MGEKITRENRKFKFETLQLHVGQEQPDPVTDARAVQRAAQMMNFRGHVKEIRLTPSICM